MITSILLIACIFGVVTFVWVVNFTRLPTSEYKRPLLLALKEPEIEEVTIAIEELDTEPQVLYLDGPEFYMYEEDGIKRKAERGSQMYALVYQSFFKKGR